MRNLILTFLVNALFILGVYYSFSKNQIFGGVREYFLMKNPMFWTPILKPFILCFVCMSSVWGTIGYILFLDYPIWYLPIYVFSLCGFMFLIKLYFYEN